MTRFALLAAVAGLFVAASPHTLDAQQRIRCESNNNRLQTCRIPDLDQVSVRMVEQLSGAACVNGRSWGTEEGRIWVDRGCRAVFEYETYRSGGGRPYPGGGGGTGEIRCESRNDRLQNCRVPNLDESSVRMVEQLSRSACVNGQSWGTQPGLIWVESGCRAVFTYRTYRAPSSQAGDNRPRQQITCSSNNNRRNECPIRNLDLSSVDLEETISGAPCIQGTSWGTGRNSSGSRLFIWVSGGCRGRFSYRTNSSTASGSGYGAPRTAEQLASLNGGQASSVDGNLRQWGFRDVDGFSSGNTRYTIWYNRATRQCVQMTTADGRAVDVRDIQTHERCR